MVGWFSGKSKAADLPLKSVSAWLDQYMDSLGLDTLHFKKDIENKKAILAKLLSELGARTSSPVFDRFEGQISRFFSDLHIPDSASELKNYASTIAEKLTLLIEAIQKDYFTLKERAPLEAESVMKKIKDIEMITVEMVSQINRVTPEGYAQARKAYEQFMHAITKIAMLEEQLLKEEARKDEPRAKLQKVLRRIDELKATRSYQVYEEFEERKHLIEQQIINHAFVKAFTVIAPLIKSAKALDDRQKVIEEYLADPASTLAKDSSLVLSDVLLQLKKKTKDEELLVLLQSLTKAMLKKYQSELHGSVKEMHFLKERMRKDSIFLMLREQLGYKESVEETLHDIDKAQEMIRNEIERTSIRLAWQKLRDALGQLSPKLRLEEYH